MLYLYCDYVIRNKSFFWFQQDQSAVLSDMEHRLSDLYKKQRASLVPVSLNKIKA